VGEAVEKGFAGGAGRTLEARVGGGGGHELCEKKGQVSWSKLGGGRYDGKAFEGRRGSKEEKDERGLS
jgi:hypothetical protein